MKRNVNATDICDLLHDEGYSFISGKWFKNQREIKNFSKEMYQHQKIRPLLQNDKDVQHIKDTFVDMYGEIGRWYEMPIIQEAKEQAELKPLCFPLNEKQLILINRLLYGVDEKFYILTGIGGSGKSTFANIIKQIFDNDYASLTLEDLCDDFKLATGINKRLVYADELNSDDLNNGIIKTISSKQEISVNPKFEKNYNAIWQGVLLFSCNKPPKLDISDSGLLRRVCYYSMNEKIKNPDLSLQKKVYTHEDLVNIVAYALRIDCTNWEEKFEQETREILRSNNSVWICRGVSLLATDYATYVQLAKDKGLKPFSEPRWEDVKNLLLQWEIDEDDLPF